MAFTHLLSPMKVGNKVYKNRIVKMCIRDRVLYYRLDKQPLAGDIIICKKNGKQYVDRVIAKGGDSVEITEEGRCV